MSALGTAQVIRANARHLPLADNSVDLICTSPPFFALRSYQDGGEHYAGQLGDEATPAEFVDALIECTREMVRVLKPAGSLFVNLGDKYAGSLVGSDNGVFTATGMTCKSDSGTPSQSVRKKAPQGNVRTKSLIGIPWRYALRCIDDLGLILRAEVIWSKPNGLPESVTDRVRRSHEQWFHLTLQPRYYSAVDEIREDYSERVVDRQRYAGRNDVPLSKDRGDRGDGNPARGILGHGHRGLSPLGKLPGSVWQIATEPLRVPEHLGVDHFAAFPCEWPKRIISGWSPGGVCVACGEGRRPVSDRTQTARGPGAVQHIGHQDPRAKEQGRQTRASIVSTHTITGYACACPEPTAPTTPSVVLDPFGGTGTTALVAKALGRHGISVDMSADYCRLAEWRTNDRDSLAKVLGIAKLDNPLIVDQLDLFGDAS